MQNRERLGVLLVCILLLSQGTARADETIYHPLYPNGEKIKAESAVIAGYVSAYEYIAHLTGEIQGLPVSGVAEEDIQGVASKGDKIWEVKFYDQNTRDISTVIILNAESGAIKIVKPDEELGQ